MTYARDSSRETDGVIYNADPNIELFTTEELNAVFVTQALNEVPDIKLKDMSTNLENGTEVAFQDDRINMASLNRFIDEYLSLEYDSNSLRSLEHDEVDMMNTKLTRLKTNPNPQGVLFDIEPPVRSNMIDGDLAIELPALRTDLNTIKDIIGPSKRVDRAEGKYVIDEPFPTGVTLRTSMDQKPTVRKLLDQTDIENKDITFAARAVTTSFDDLIDL